MYVANLTLRGFKSFASATSFTLEPGITCVVGPNGSGKSNVVDALAWVMGEQGAKTLRGGKMEDVIFAGTSGRPPLGRAQVTMTIDNSDGALPIDYSEVTISRTMFRTGSSEYAINGTSCRLLDIQELLSDSGIGKEMHVIVGQGRLDDVLRATPEQRRGLIEEAAGVLKHRRRKEKALRKLETMEGNLTRVVDLATEVRRQLGPLGRQAETARKAALWQAQLRDARLRLLADDLVQRQATLSQEQADDSALKARAARVETELADARAEVEQAGARSAAVAARADEVGRALYDLSTLRDRFTAHARLAAERIDSLRHREESTHARGGRDPEQLRADAARAREQEQGLTDEVEQRRAELDRAKTERSEAETAHTAERDRIAAFQRAAAARRDGLAKLAGQVAAKESRVDTLEAQRARSAEELAVSTRRAAAAEKDYLALESELAGEAGETEGVDAALTRAQNDYAAAADTLAAAQRAYREAAGERDRARARREALELALAGTGDAGRLLADDAPASLGPFAALLQVHPGHETAVAAALGALGEAVTYASVEQALAGVDHLRTVDAGRASLVVTDEAYAAGSSESAAAVPLPDGAVWATDVVTCSDEVRPAVRALLAATALVRDGDQAVALVGEAGRSGRVLTAVTPSGDVFSPAVVNAGGDAGTSRLELQAARDGAASLEESAGSTAERARQDVAAASRRAELAKMTLDEQTAALRAADAALAARTEKLAGLRATMRAATGQVDQLRTALTRAEEGLAVDKQALIELRERHREARAAPEAAEPDTAELTALETAAANARASETSALLALRTAEERLRAIAGRADGLESAARKEDHARVEAARRRADLGARIEATRALREVAQRAATRLELSIEVAAAERETAATERVGLEESVARARVRADELAEQQRLLTDTAHREEMARAELRLRIEALVTKAGEEYGVTEAILVDEYGPDRLIEPVPDPNARSAETDAEADPDQGGDETVTARADGNAEDSPERADEEGKDKRPAAPTRTKRRARGEPPEEPYPYVREEQEKLAADREKKLARLGRINPLALEEYAALEERHSFLNAQIEDLRAGKRDLLTIVADVDERVQKAFLEAFEDTAAEFSGVFSRLFPGGEGRLVLTEPDSPLTTGIEVEARPPGKKVKRLSLLSGGERSLTAMALLVSIFKARPSPFYIMDEVEAALDDVNLGRLLMLFEELRETSQLIVITHQKRTMERADALYGVTMRGDGVTTVVSQRIRGREHQDGEAADTDHERDALVQA